MLQDMLNSMTLRFQTIGLYIQEAKTVWTSTNKGHMSEFTRICGTPVECSDPEIGLPILGSQISFLRSLGCDYTHKISSS